MTIKFDKYVFQLVIGVCLAVNISIIVLEAELNFVSQKRIKDAFYSFLGCCLISTTVAL